MAMVESVPDSNRPALILDVDGVFQIWRQLEGNPDGYIEHPRFPWLAYNPTHGEWLGNIHDTATDMYYISDWQALSHWTIGQHLKMPELDWINTDGYKARKSAARRALAITALFGERPLIWLDDCIRPAEKAWGRQRNEAGAPTLLVKTNPDVGVQLRHMRRIDKWLAQLTDR